MSVLARVYEDMGLVTTGLVLIEEHAKRVKPPRMLSVPFNFGNTLGGGYLDPNGVSVPENISGVPGFENSVNYDVRNMLQGSR